MDLTTPSDAVPAAAVALFRTNEVHTLDRPGFRDARRVITEHNLKTEAKSRSGR
jgi:hypothetical protein